MSILNYIVAPSRDGWAVSLNSDRLSDYASVEDARMAARTLVEIDRRQGLQPVLVDLGPRRGDARG